MRTVFVDSATLVTPALHSIQAVWRQWRASRHQHSTLRQISSLQKASEIYFDTVCCI